MNKIYMLADLHGDWRHISALNTRLKEKLDETDTIILLGDTGINFFFDKRDEARKERLSSYKCKYFLIRGNHEERPSILYNRNPNWSVTTYFGGNVYYEINYPNILYAHDDVRTYNINGYSTLVIPGAYSVDKYYRLQNGWEWFRHEQLTKEEMARGQAIIEKNNFKFDIVLSHTCPIMYEPTDLFLNQVDQSTVDKTMERYLGEIEYKIDYKLWCWGHYHKYRQYPMYQGRQPVMLYNDSALDLNETMKSLDEFHCVVMK